jgi:hypothetical protein
MYTGLDRFSKNIQITKFLVGAKLFHANRKNMTKLIVAFHNFMNEPENNLCTFGC